MGVERHRGSVAFCYSHVEAVLIDSPSIHRCIVGSLNRSLAIVNGGVVREVLRWNSFVAALDPLRERRSAYWA